MARRPIVRVATCVAALLASALAGVGLASPAFAADGSMAGTVTVTGGAPLADATVSISDASTQAFVVSAVTDAAGAWSTPIAPGSYTVEFDATDHVTQWYAGQPTAAGATTVTVGDAQDVNGIDAQLVPFGAVAGTVKQTGGSVLSDASVSIVDPASQAVVTSATTGVDGTYTASVAPGTYRAEFTAAGHLGQWWDGKADVATANDIVVTAGATHGAVNATLVTLGTISGHVSGPGNAPLENITVTAELVPGGDVFGATTGAGGDYTVSDLPPGSYRLDFSDPSYVHEWYDNATTSAAATLVPVAAAANVTGISASLAAAATISGTVTGTGGTPLSGVLVTAEDLGGGPGGSTTTASDGTFTVNQLQPGSYRLFFDPPTGAYIGEFWADTRSQAAATPVTAAAGDALTGFAVSLAAAATISGTATVPAGSDVTTVQVSVDSTTAVGDSTSTSPAANGTWSVQVPAGSYTVSFTGLRLVDQWWHATSSAGLATPVTVPAGGTATGINAAMERFSGLAGTITGPTGAPLANRTVDVLTPAGAIAASAFTDASGAWSADSLLPGSYRVQVQGDAAAGQVDTWYPGTAFVSGATTITLAAHQDKAGINVQVVRGGLITGTVTGPGGAIPERGVVEVYAKGGAQVATAPIDAGGLFEVLVPPGQLEVLFRGFTAYVGGTDVPLDSEWYSNAPTRATATTVGVTSGLTTTGVNASLVAGTAFLSGVVTGPGATPLKDASVVVWDAVAGTFLGFATTSASGAYTVAGLPSGDVAVDFGPPAGSGLLREYYDGKHTLDTATPVTLAAGQSRTGVSAQLEPAASVVGTVTGPSALHLPGVLVDITDDTGGIFNSVATGADGTYRLDDLPAGTYHVSFRLGSLQRWYSHALDQASDTPVVLTTGQHRTGVDETFPEAAILAGSVSGPSAPLPGALVQVSSTTDPGTSVVTHAGAAGAFAVAVPAGTYTLRFSSSGPAGAFAPEWWSNATTEASATPVTVAAGQTHGALNAMLSPEAAITGLVSKPNALPAPDIQVQAYDPAGSVVATTSSAADGTYALYLAPGSYRVSFGIGQSLYTPEYWNNSATLAGATTIVLTTGQTAAGTNAVLDGSVVPVGTLKGTVTVPGGGPAAGVTVEACDWLTHTCTTTKTDAAGAYTMDAPATGITVHFYAPTGSGLLTTAKTTTVAPAATTTLDAALGSLELPPPGTTVSGGRVTTDGVPVVTIGRPFDLQTTGCSSGSASYSITDGRGTESGTLIEVSPGVYKRSITTQLYGAATVTITITCPSGPPKTVSFDLYIDPSGVVSDTGGAPVAAATVTLYRSDTEVGPYSVVPNGSDIMSPSNRKNPDTTGADGVFRWDTKAGWYKVRAAKPGCFRPGQPGTAFVETPALQVPPPQVDLSLVLECPSTDTVAPTLSLGAWPAVSFTPGKPIALTLAGTDNVAVTGYRVQRRAAAAGALLGGWTVLPQLPPSARGTTTSAPAGSTVCLRVQSFDAAGHSSPWVERCTSLPVDDAALVASKAGRAARSPSQWVRAKRISGAYLATTSSSRTKNATLTLAAARGRRVVVVAPVGPGGGKVGIYAAGKLVGTASLAAPKAKARVTFTFASPGLAAKAGPVVVKVLVPGKAGVRVDGVALLKQ